jgi:hypothetical protein
MSKIIVDDLKLTYTPIEDIPSKINLLKKGFARMRLLNIVKALFFPTVRVRIMTGYVIPWM